MRVTAFDKSDLQVLKIIQVPKTATFKEVLEKVNNKRRFLLHQSHVLIGFLFIFCIFRVVKSSLSLRTNTGFSAMR